MDSSWPRNRVKFIWLDLVDLVDPISGVPSLSGWRLHGWSLEDYESAESVCSNTVQEEVKPRRGGVQSSDLQTFRPPDPQTFRTFAESPWSKVRDRFCLGCFPCPISLYLLQLIFPMSLLLDFGRERIHLIQYQGTLFTFHSSITI